MVHNSSRIPMLAAALVALGAWTADAAAGTAARTPKKSGSSYGFTTGQTAAERFSYAIVKPSPQRGSLNVNGSAGSGDWKQLHRLIERDPREVFFVRLSDRSYVTRDADAIAKARAILAPMTRIGDKQSALGERQSELGERQSALGERQSGLGDRQSALGKRLARVHERLAEERSDAAYRSLDEQREEIELEMAELGRQMEALGREQSVLGASQAALGREQSALGRQQAVESRKAQETMRRHTEELMEQGLLEPIE